MPYPQQQHPQQQYPASPGGPGYPPQPPYGYGYPQQPSSSTNGLGVAGFVCGLLGLVFFWIPFVGIVLAILGVIMGAAGMTQARRVHNSAGLAIAGLVLGIIALIPAIIFLIAVNEQLTAGPRPTQLAETDKPDRSCCASTRTLWPSRMVPARSCFASASPIEVCTSRRSGRAP